VSGKGDAESFDTQALKETAVNYCPKGQKNYRKNILGPTFAKRKGKKETKEQKGKTRKGSGNTERSFTSGLTSQSSNSSYPKKKRVEASCHRDQLERDKRMGAPVLIGKGNGGGPTLTKKIVRRKKNSLCFAETRA